MTRTQFIVAMATHIAIAGQLRGREALAIASRAYQEFMADVKVPFGHADYAWDADTAKIVASEYETAHW